MPGIEQDLEPKPDPESGGVKVGDLVLPVTSLLTALLRGYAGHSDPHAKDYYFWRIADELWNRPDLLEEMLVRNPWAERIVSEFHRNKYLSVGGAASSGKSYVMAAVGIVNWLSSPHDTLVLMTSTTLKAARQRIWGATMTLLSVIDDLPGRVRDSMGSVNYVNENGVIFDRAGLALIAAEKSRTREAIGKFIGIKQNNIVVIADELSEISEAIINACLSNLSANPNLRVTGLSNPDSPFDAFGSWSTPKKGWDSVDLLTAEEWPTKWGGKYIRLDGERSPNVLAGKEVYPKLPTAEKLAENREILGQNSRAYLRMVRAVFFFGDEASGVYSDADISACGGMSPVEWASAPVLVGGLDPAFTNGGDRTILYTGKVGYDTKGAYVFEFGDTYVFNDDSTNKAVPRTYQIVQQVKDTCQKLKLLPDNLLVDATGAGAPFCDVLAGEWSPRVGRVVFGGVPSDLRVSQNSRLTGKDVYFNRVSEMWFAGKELLRTRQLRGISPELAQELVARRYDMVKGTSTKLKLEPKADFKGRFGRSPDLADAGFLALAAARHFHGLVAVDPPGEPEEGKAPRPKPKKLSFAELNNAMTNPEAELVGWGD